MKAKISLNGVLVVTPENETEAFALARWSSTAAVTVMHDVVGALQMKGDKHWNLRNLTVNTTWPVEVSE